MTNATMALAELAEKSADIDVLRQMVRFAAQRQMELETETLCGAGYDGGVDPQVWPVAFDRAVLTSRPERPAPSSA